MGRFLWEARRIAQDLEGCIVNPELSTANQNHAEIDRLRIRLDVPSDLVVLPSLFADGTIIHVVKKTQDAALAVHAKPKLRLALGAHGSAKPHALAAIRRAVEGLHKVAEGPTLSFRA